jgi:ClpP class serine protease
MWLLESNIKQKIEKAEASGIMPNAEQQNKLDARHSGSPIEKTPRILSINESTAKIDVKGVLTNSPDFFAMIFGGGNTTYSEIASAINIAENNENIDNIELNIDSPGGSVDGLFDMLAVIQSATKPVTAVVSNLAASAAFAIASQADNIVATNKAARFGSIGIVGTFNVADDIIEITSTEAPKKRPDVTTDDGKAMVIEELDALHEIFVDAIADGRNTTVKKVNANFGQGAALLANEALKRGMIDDISSNTKTSVAAIGENKMEAIMDLKTLKAQHADVYTAAVQEGKDTELDRVTAHLTMGEASGDMDTAVKAIKDGSVMTQTLQAAYMTAGMNRKDLSNRNDDDIDANAGDNVDAGDNNTNSVVDLVESKLGV